MTGFWCPSCKSHECVYNPPHQSSIIFPETVEQSEEGSAAGWPCSMLLTPCCGLHSCQCRGQSVQRCPALLSSTLQRVQSFTLLRGPPQSTIWWKPVGREKVGIFVSWHRYVLSYICRAIYWKWISKPFKFLSDLRWLICLNFLSCFS